MKIATALVALCSIAKFAVAAPVDAPAALPGVNANTLDTLSVVSQNDAGITFAGQNGDWYWLPLTAYAALIGIATGTTIGGLAFGATHKKGDDVAEADMANLLTTSKSLAAEDKPVAPEGTKELSLVGAQEDKILVQDASGEFLWCEIGLAAVIGAIIAAGAGTGIATLRKGHDG